MTQNSIIATLLGHNKWYVQATVRFAPKWVHTFTEKRKACATESELMFGTLAWDRIDHGYMSHHPLEFLYRWTSRFARRKVKFQKCSEVTGRQYVIPLRGSLDK